MKKTIFTTILVLFVWAVNHAQEVKFGKVSMEELTQTAHPIEPDAEAAVLYRSYTTFFDYGNTSGFQLLTEVHERIKIYKKTGFRYATIRKLLYQNKSAKEKISKLKGITYNLENGKITETKLDKSGIFTEDYNDFYELSTFTLPNVKEGSVLDIEYTIYSPFAEDVEEIRFQQDIPVNFVNASFNHPDFYTYRQHWKGFYPVVSNYSTNSKSINLGGYYGESVSQSADKNIRTESFVYQEKIYGFTAKNIPSLKNEAYVNNIDNYRSSVNFELNTIKFPNSPIKVYSQTWNDVAKSMYEFSSFGGELSKSGYFKDDLNKLITGVDDPLKKAVLIFNHVKNKVNWNRIERSTSRKGVSKAYEEGVGSSADINLILTAMFREAGLKSNPVLVSTRDNGIPMFPTIDGFNYVIAAIEMQEGIVLFDATEKYAVPNILPERAINWMGRLVREDGTSIEVSLLPKTPSKQVTYFSAQLNEDGSAEGKVRIQNYDQYAFNFREKIKNLDKDLYLERLENNTFNSDIEVANYQMQNESDLSKPVIENFEFKKEDQCEIIGGKIYVSPLLFSGLIENPLKLEKREYPIEFSFPTTKQYLITINIPEGYQIESVPESLALQLPEDIGSYQYNITAKANQIQVKLTSEIKSPLISAEGYEMIKNYYQQIVQKNLEKIVLTKI